MADTDISCPTGKVRHESRAKASGHLAHIDRNRRVANQPYGGKAYRCQLCGSWHVGKKQKNRTDRKVRR